MVGFAASMQSSRLLSPITSTFETGEPHVPHFARFGVKDGVFEINAVHPAEDMASVRIMSQRTNGQGRRLSSIPYIFTICPCTTSALFALLAIVTNFYRVLSVVSDLFPSFDHGLTTAIYSCSCTSFLSEQLRDRRIPYTDNRWWIWTGLHSAYSCSFSGVSKAEIEGESVDKRLYRVDDPGRLWTAAM